MSLNIDSACADAFQDLVSNSETNFIVFAIEGKDVTLASSGTGGVPELREFLNNLGSAIAFGAFVVKGVDDREATTSVRTKVCNFTYVGSGVSVLKKAKVSVQRGEVFDIMQGVAVSIDVDGDADDALSAEAVKAELLKCGGAHKPTSYDLGGGETIPIEKYGD